MFKIKKLLSATLVATTIAGIFPVTALASVNTAVPTITHAENKGNSARLQWDVPIATESVFFNETFENLALDLPQGIQSGIYWYGNGHILDQWGNPRANNDPVRNSLKVVSGAGINNSRGVQVNKTSPGGGWNFEYYSYLPAPNPPNGASSSQFSVNGWKKLKVGKPAIVRVKAKGVGGMDVSLTSDWSGNAYSMQNVTWAENLTPNDFKYRLQNGIRIKVNNPYGYTNNRFHLATAKTNKYDFNFYLSVGIFEKEGGQWYYKPTEWHGAWSDCVKPGQSVTGSNRAVEQVVSGQPITVVHSSGGNGASTTVNAQNWQDYSFNISIPSIQEIIDTGSYFRLSTNYYSNQLLNIDDLTIAYASKSRVYRDGVVVHEGNTVEFTDTNAKDMSAPNTPNIAGIEYLGQKVLLSWAPVTDKGNNYTYQVVSVNEDNVESAKSGSKIVNVTSGVAKYQVFKNGQLLKETTTPNVEINATDFKNITIYAIDNVGNKSLASNSVGDTVQPTFGSVEIKNVSDDGYDVYVYEVTDTGSGIDRVMFPTWTSANGQDDLLANWSNNPLCKGEDLGNGTWQYRVNRSEHNNEFGHYITHIYVYDKVDNKAMGSTAISLSDATKPQAQHTVSNSNLTNGQVVINITSTDIGTGVKRIKLPNGQYIAGGKASYSVSKNGNYVFEIEDNAGNMLSYSVLVENIDTIKPEATHTLSPSEWTNKDVTITLNPTDVQGSRVVKRVKLPNGQYVDRTMATYTVSENGTYTFEIEDTVTNKTLYPVTVTNIDKMAPTLPGAKIEGDTLLIVQSTDIGSGVNRYEYSLNSGGWAEWEAPLSLIGLPDQTHTFRVKAIDKVGNVSSEYEYSFETTYELQKATEAVDKAEETLNQSDHDRAKDLVKKLLDSPEKEDLLERLDKIQDEITEQEIVDRLDEIQNELEREDLTQEEYEEILGELEDLEDKINQLPDSNGKGEIGGKLDQISQGENDKAEELAKKSKAEYLVRLAEGHMREPYVTKANEEIFKLPAGQYKGNLQSRMVVLEEKLSKDGDKTIKAVKDALARAKKYNREPYYKQVEKLIAQLKEQANRDRYEDQLELIKKGQNKRP